MNQITSIHVFSSGTTEVNEPELANASGIVIATIYPGGIYSDASFTIPRDVTQPWRLIEGYRITFYSGLACVWEGIITGKSYNFAQDGQSATITCLGYWSGVLMVRTWRKPWADTNIDEDAWADVTTATAYDKCDIDRQDRIRFTPKGVAFTATQGTGVSYTAPTGETVKRVTFSYDLQAGGQNWQIELVGAASAVLWSTSTTGTGTVDHTLATPTQTVYLVFRANANQTAVEDGTYYGEFSDITVYTETGSINVTEIAKDVREHVTELSSYEGAIYSNTYSLVPFVSDGGETIADILNRAASYGAATTYLPWACGILASDNGTDSKPVLYCAQQPSVTVDYEYVLRLDDANVSDVTFEQDIATLANWIAYEYTNSQGVRFVVTPDDDSALKDTTSITAYGEHHAWLSISSTSSSVSANFAKRYLKTKKDLQWTAGGGIPIIGTITTKTGNVVPVCQLRAGTRVRIMNFLDDFTGTSSGVTFLITATSYEDDTQTNTIEIGRPEYLLSGLQARIDDGRKLR